MVNGGLGLRVPGLDSRLETDASPARLDRGGERARLGLVEDEDGLLQLPAVVEVGSAREWGAVDSGEAGREGVRAP